MVDEGIEDGHCFVGDTGDCVNSLQYYSEPNHNSHTLENAHQKNLQKGTHPDRYTTKKSPSSPSCASSPHQQAPWRSSSAPSSLLSSLHGREWGRRDLDVADGDTNERSKRDLATSHCTPNPYLRVFGPRVTPGIGGMCRGDGRGKFAL